MAKPFPSPISDAVKARFWGKVDVRGPDECWPWTAFRATNGYGRFTFANKSFSAHRLACHLSGPAFADHLVVDHLCRNRACCNPAHLRPVTHSENVRVGTSPTAKNAVKTHCDSGHPLAGDNLGFRRSDGYRYCKACLRVGRRAHKARLKAACAALSSTDKGEGA